MLNNPGAHHHHLVRDTLKTGAQPDMSRSVPTNSWNRQAQKVSDLLQRTAIGPWFDPIALYALKRWMFPLSRMWAAATVANGDVDQFVNELELSQRTPDRHRIAKALALTDEARAVSAATDQAWQRVFFDAPQSSSHHCQLIERARRGRRHEFYAARRHFRFLRTASSSLAKQSIETPDETAERFGGIAEGTEHLAPVSGEMPTVTQSNVLERSHVTEQWLRFASPSKAMNDAATAHVYAPVGVNNPPTLIFGHGVCVEPEHWRGLVDEVATLVRLGIRVIRPEAPWHGYRTPKGYYGGERLIEVFPSAPLDAFSAALQEWSVLTHWARATSKGAVGFGGTSLGALMAQRAADESRHWPSTLRPDALFLITHSGNILQTIIEGDLTRLWGEPEKALEKGWDEETAARYLDVLNPGPYLPVAGQNIVSVLGSRDTVTPFKSGKHLLDRWAVPDANRFIWWRGHFSVPLTLYHDPTPVKRFAEIMHRL